MSEPVAVAVSDEDAVPATASISAPVVSPVDIVRAQLKKFDTMVDEYYMTSQQLDAYAAYFESDVYAVEALDCLNARAFVGFVKSNVSGGLTQVPMTIDELLALCELSTHAGSARLRQLLSDAPDTDAKYRVLVSFFVDSGIEDLRGWEIEGTVDLLALRVATMEATEDVLARFDPDAMTVCCV